MARDYAKQRSARHSHETSSAGWKWLLAGIVVGLFIAGLMYIKNHAPNAPASGGTMLAHDDGKEHKKERKHSVEKEKSSSQPKFDFYTILPKVQVPAPAKGLEDEQKPSAQLTKAVTVAAENEQQAKTAHAETSTAPDDTFALNADDTKSEKKVTTPTNNLPPADQQLLPASKPVKKLTPVASTLAPSLAATAANATTATTSSPVVTATKPAVKSPVSSSYILKIATLKHSQDADQLKAQLALLGFDVNIREVKVNSESWSQVWVGPYANVQAATKEQRRLQENNIKSTIAKM